MPFCYAPWTNIDISPQGNISPCCKFQHNLYDYKKHNIIASDIAEYTNSELLNEIKQNFLQDQWPRGCERCWIEEENQVESKRQLDYERWQEHYDNYDIANGGYLTASVAFGNTCNLKCITCGPQSSSRWYKEYQLIYSTAVKPNHFYKENFVEDFTAQCTELIHLDIPGGEPFLSGVTQQQELLDYYIKTDQAKHITLHYTTNATVYPDSTWWTKWKHFKEIDMQLSIDGTGSHYEYIRYPANWQESEENIDRYLQAEKNMNNLRLSVSYTLSAYNVYYLDDFLQWCQHKGLPRPWIGRVHRPTHMRPSVWPESIKNKIVQHLETSSDPDSLRWASLIRNQDDSEHYNDFLEKTKLHEEYRGNSFSDVFPELEKLINENE